MLALAAAAGWVGGLYLASHAGWPTWLFALLAVAGAALLAAALRWRFVALPLVVVLLAFGLGGLRFVSPSPGGDDAAHWRGSDDMGVRGVVLDEPRRSAWTLRVRLTVDAVRPQDVWLPAGGQVEVTLPRSAVARLGDRLELWGRLEEPSWSEQFDYAAYLARQGVFSMMRYPERYRRLQANDERLSPFTALNEHLAHVVGRLLPQPHAGIAEGLLLGRKSGLTAEVSASFQRSGMTHLLVVSGYNVMLVAGLFLWLAERRLRRPVAVVVALAAVLVYVLVVGPDPPVLRAGLMAVLGLWALAFGRTGDALNGLALAVVVMTAFEPHALLDLSFQLSCVATAGLVLLAPTFERPLAGLPAWLRTGLATTIAAQVATAPILALNFGRLQVVGLPSNALALPLVPFATLSAGLATLAAVVWEPLGQALAAAPWLLIAWLLWISAVFGSVPWAEVEAPGVDAAWAWPYYGLLLLAGARQTGLPHVTALYERARAWASGHPRLAVGCGCLALLTIGSGAALATTQSPAAVHFLDVGEGDATLVVGPGGEHVLIDAGPPGPDTLASVGRRLPFFRRTLDLVILTDADSEHLGGLPELAERYDVRMVIEPAQMRPSALSRRWREVVTARGITVHSAAPGMRVTWPGLEIGVLDPGALAADGRTARAVAVQVRLGEHVLLVPGDAPPEQQQALAGDASIRASALRVPLRGGVDALERGLVEAVRPDVAVVSAGRGNRWGHPRPEVLDILAAAGVRALRTDLHGTVTLTPDGRGWAAATAREPEEPVASR